MNELTRFPTVPFENVSGINIYTDGSKMNNRVGGAFVVYEGSTLLMTRNFELDGENSVYQAETIAIREAVRWSAGANFKTFVLHTDSLSALQALENYIPPNDHIDIIFEIIKNCPTKNFVFNWVKAHVGIEGNERADREAKNAVQMGGDDIFHEALPSSFLKQHLKKLMMSDWQKHWNTSEKGRETYRVLKYVNADYICKNVICGYFLSGHGSFPTFLKKIGKMEDDLCGCGKRGSPSHYLFSPCSLVGKNFKMDSNLTLGDNIRRVLLNPDNYDDLKRIYNVLNKHYSFIKYSF